MIQTQRFERSLQRSRTSLSREDRPKVFALCGREWDLLDEVFAPVFCPSTAIAVDFLDLDGPVPPPVPRGASFLEIGCGSGVTAVMAALAGYDHVVAADISPRAVENTAANAERHGVEARLRAVHSDLFSGLASDERFDLVFWSSNYVLAPEDYQYQSVHERAYVDTGYRAHRRFLEQVLHWLTPTGSALLHFSDRGDLPELHRIAGQSGRELTLLRSVRVTEPEYGGDVVEHMLFEIRAARVTA
ncbi:methyltransferase domain-containing protein [Streptomyces sp. NPDC048603]|uniref:methyltransferase domain-containing protein n=1 Tax=Streptomyces sp. NPDC048603 TaxID=3365577 RepID=UPI00371A67C9